jgi:hypothetical protein
MQGKTQERLERGSRKRSSSSGSEKMERVGDRQEKNGRRVFDRPKPTEGFRAIGRRREEPSNLPAKCCDCCNSVNVS